MSGYTLAPFYWLVDPSRTFDQHLKLSRDGTGIDWSLGQNEASITYA
jgi:hypothetical protein